MFTDMEKLKIKSVLHKTTKHFGKVESRKASSLIIRVSGAIRYSFDDRDVVVSEGEMIFLPEGSHYEYKKISEEEVVATIISVDGDFSGIAPFVCSVKDYYDIDYIMYHMADMWKFGSLSQRCQCLSLFYGLLAYISNVEELQYPQKKKFSIIDPAVAFLKKHIYDCELQIDKLHQLCNISDTYFRKIFVARFGTSPKNYVVSKRLTYAKSIIDSGEFSTVKELSEMVGYKDPLYFGKAFRNHYGVSPANMTK